MSLNINGLHVGLDQTLENSILHHKDIFNDYHEHLFKQEVKKDLMRYLDRWIYGKRNSFPNFDYSGAYFDVDVTIKDRKVTYALNTDVLLFLRYLLDHGATNE